MKVLLQTILFSLLLGCAGKTKEKNVIVDDQKITAREQAEENKKIIKRYLLDIINNRKLELLGEVFPAKFVRHDMNDSTDTWMTVADQQKRLTGLIEAFPGFRYTINDIMAEGDKVVVRTVWHGTQNKTFMGVESSGNRIDNVSEIIFYRLENGKIAERWTQLDLHSLFKKMKGEPHPPSP